MNANTKRTSCLIVGLVCILAPLLAASLLVPFFVTDKSIPQEDLIAGIALMCCVYSLLLFIGIYTLVRGFRTHHTMSKGRKRECTILSIEDVKNSAFYKEVTVSYRGESGEKYQHIVPLITFACKKLKVGQVIECYINKESCYVDEENIKILREPEEEM